jgi:hypothetical protein
MKAVIQKTVVPDWLKENQGVYRFQRGFNTAIFFLVLTINLLWTWLLFKGSLTGWQHFLITCLIALTWLYLISILRSLHVARQLYIDQSGIRVEPHGLKVSREDILGIEEKSIGSFWVIDVSITSPRLIWSPGFIHSNISSYRFQLMRKK